MYQTPAALWEFPPENDPYVHFRARWYTAWAEPNEARWATYFDQNGLLPSSTSLLCVTTFAWRELVALKDKALSVQTRNRCSGRLYHFNTSQLRLDALCDALLQGFLSLRRPPARRSLLHRHLVLLHRQVSPSWSAA